MKTIKTKANTRGIKVLEKAPLISTSAKSAYIKTKSTAEGAQNTAEKPEPSYESSPTEYTIDRMQDMAKAAAVDSITRLKGQAEKVVSSFDTTQVNENQQEPTLRSNDHRGRKYATGRSSNKPSTDHGQHPESKWNSSKRRGFKATAQEHLIRDVKVVKSSKRAARQTAKAAKRTERAGRKTVKAAIVTSKATSKTAQVAAKTAVRTTKLVAKALVLSVKAIIAATKGLISLIATGGIVAVVIIIIICMIAVLVGSVFGVFFSGESNPDTGQSINSVIAEVDAEYTQRLDDIIFGNAHDELDMSGSRALWRNVLAVYTVRTVTDSSNPMEVATIDDEKATILREVFWAMNTITYVIDLYHEVIDIMDEYGVPTGETYIETTRTLRITTERLTVTEAASLYGFNADQHEWLEELLNPEYISLWNMLLFGITSVGDSSLVEVAITQLGNVGGEPYWRWYGFQNRVPWCATFVSWCADQIGYIEAGVIPRFALCAAGVQWFRDRGQWQDRSYTPNIGDIIFFDWNADGIANHVGIVERVEGAYVHTIEGNTSDSVRRRSYRLDSIRILGYGVPIYM